MKQIYNILNKISTDLGCLYIISTPIGNLNDISLRCIKTLNDVKYILCEDTRITGKLLKKFGVLNKKLISYNDHNANKKRRLIINNLLKNNISYGLVSDSGTPLISDPGYKLVKECLTKQIKVTHIPGPSSLLSGLVLSGLPSDNFIFCGFFEKNKTKKIAQINKFLYFNMTTIWFETSNRILKTLRDLFDFIGNRKISILRELTKLNEEIIHGNIQDVIIDLEKRIKIKGEIVLIIEGKQEKSYTKNEIDELIVSNMNNKTTKDLSKFVSDKTSLPKKIIYNRIIEIRKK